jgi:hemicentin
VVQIEAAHGGVPCEGEVLETKECEDAPCPVDCEVTEWKTAGDCSHSCGGGEQVQRRTVSVPAANDGEPCPGDLVRDSLQ